MVADMGNRRDDPGSQARVCQIVAIALIAGASTFVGVALFIRASGGKGLLAPDPWDVTPVRAIISLLSLAIAASMIVMSFVVPRVMTEAMRRQIAKGEFPRDEAGNRLATEAGGAFRMAFMQKLIVGLALLEGAAFFCGISFLIEGKLPPLIASVVLILLMIARFPTNGAIDGFVDGQDAKLVEDRMSA